MRCDCSHETQGHSSVVSDVRLGIILLNAVKLRCAIMHSLMWWRECLQIFHVKHEFIEGVEACGWVAVKFFGNLSFGKDVRGVGCVAE